MEMQQENSAGKSEIKLSGELDMHSSPQLRKVLMDLVKKRAAHIVINLEGISYIDSSGLATLVECMQGTSLYQGRLQLTGVHARIRPVFELARLDKVFEISS